MGRDASDSGIDLVEDERLSSRDGSEGESDAGELAARRRLGDRAERQARIRADPEDRLVPTGRPRITVAELDVELALPHADAPKVLGDRLGETGCRGCPRVVQCVATSTKRSSACVESCGRRLQGIAARLGRLELRECRVSPIEELVGRLRDEPPPCVRDQVEALLDELDPFGVGLERCDEPVQVTADFLQTVDEIAKLGGSRLELGCERA